MEEENAQYVQYVYDTEGNRVRQFTGMTAPLTLTVSETKAGTEVTDSVKDTPAADTDKNEKTDQPDTFTYAGKTYVVTVGGRKKSDTVHETKYEYNGKNQLISYTDPEGREETYTYDVNGNLTRTVDKNGNTLENTYDYQNRLTATAAVPKGQGKKKGKETTHTFRYNAYGEVSAQDDTVFAYGDVSGQVTEETAELTKNKKIVKKYEYDSAGNRTTFSVGAGGETKLSLTYAYDGMSRLTSVKDENGEDTVLYNYDTEGNLSGRTVPGAGLTTAYTYDCQNRLITLQNRTDRAGVVSGYRSAYLLNGKKSEETSECLNKDGEKETKTANYTYDMLGRVTKEEKTGNADITYTYDNHNNRKQMKAGNKLTAYKYNQNDELLRIDTLNTDTEEDSVILYKNDRNGNQLATVNRYPIPDDKKTGTYVDIDVTLGDNRLNGNVVNHYNAQNELIQTLTRGYKVSFTYDAAGLRNSKTVNGEKTVYVWDGDQLVLELSGSGKIQNRYIRGVDLIYADRGKDTGKQYYVTDPHGNVVQLIDGSGEVVRTYEYDSFGNEVDPDSRDENPFRYCGEYFDRETGEVYLRARYYRPETGRFLTRDTYTGEAEEPLSLHLYTYCENDGVNGVDPSGHGWFKDYTKYKLLLVAKDYLLKRRYHVTYDMFFHALYGEGKRYGNGILWNALKESKKYKAYKEGQRKILRKNDNEDLYIHSKGIEYTKGDLYYAVQHATVTCAAFRKGRYWQVQFAIYDTFDFTEIRIPTSVGSAANDMGVFLQFINYFTPYNWSFTEKERIKIVKK